MINYLGVLSAKQSRYAEFLDSTIIVLPFQFLTFNEFEITNVDIVTLFISSTQESDGETDFETNVSITHKGLKDAKYIQEVIQVLVEQFFKKPVDEVWEFVEGDPEGNLKS